MKKPTVITVALASAVSAFLGTAVLLGPPTDGKVQYPALEVLWGLPENDTSRLGAMRDTFDAINSPFNGSDVIVNALFRAENSMTRAVLAADAALASDTAVAER